MPFRRTLSVALAAGVASLVVGGSPAQAMQLGFTDQSLVGLASPSDTQAGLQNASRAGSSVWRFYVRWAVIAPQRPPSSAVAADPAWPGYNWAKMDATVREIAASGQQPLPFISGAPRWAEGANRPSTDRAPAGTWRPSPAHFRSFAVALATRYSGTFPDPRTPGATLPRIRTWQAWNEPNLSVDLTPQWTRSGNRWVAASPRLYRGLLNAFFSGVKSVSTSNFVVTAGTAPYGDLNEGDPRMPPVRFWRELLCMSGGRVPKARACSKVSFDALAHHPYPIGPPRRAARNADDAVVPDVRKITRLLPGATRRGTIRPAGAKPLWITEISWDSRPDPDGLSLEQQATYLQGALYVLYQQGADVVTWFNLRDQAPTPSYGATYQSGIYLRGSTPAEDVAKPSLTAFRFPFTAYRTRGVARLWGMAPAGGTVTIEARQGDRWVTATRLRAKSNRIFSGRLRVGQGVSLRAVWNSDTSLVWRTF